MSKNILIGLFVVAILYILFQEKIKIWLQGTIQPCTTCSEQ